MPMQMTKYERTGRTSRPGTKRRQAWAAAIARENRKIWERVDAREAEQRAAARSARKVSR